MLLFIFKGKIFTILNIAKFCVKSSFAWKCRVKSLLKGYYTRWAEKKMNKTSTYNSGCLAVIIRLLFNQPNALWLWRRRKRFVIVMHIEMSRQRDTRVKLYALLRAGLEMTVVANLVGPAQPSTRSRSAWTMAKV